MSLGYPLKIAFIENRGTLFGGGQVSLKELILNLPSAYEPIVIAPTSGSFIRSIEDRAAVILMSMPGFRHGSIENFRTIARFKRVFGDHAVEIVHANAGRAMIYGGVAAKLLGIPTIWHVRIAERDFPLDDLLYRLADRIIVNSQTTGQRFRKFPDRDEKVRTIYNGVDSTIFGKTMMTRQAFPLKQSDEFVVGNIARFVDFKRLDLFVEAASRIALELPKARFVLVGSGPLFQRIEGMAHKCSLPIHFVGQCDDVPAILPTFDVLMVSSIGEPFGRMAIEAMAAAKPVVAFASGGMLEIVEDGKTGYLVEPENIQAMADKVIILARNENLARRLGRAGKARIDRCFSIEQHVKGIIEVYDELYRAS